MLATATLGASAEQIDDFAPFFIDTEAKTLLYLKGDINSQTDYRLGRVLKRFPEVETLVLSSRGGTVYDALSMSATIREYELKTRIPAGGDCFSACAYMFFAGVERESKGNLGVHRLAGLGDDITFSQEVLFEVFDSLHSYGVPFEIVLKMLQTPPEDMFIYGPEELAAMNLLGPVEDTATSPGAPPSAPPPAATIANALKASDPSGFLRFFQKLGYRPELTSDSVGDPMIKFRHEAETLYLLFYDCVDHADCAAVQYYAGYPTDGSGTVDVINDWNAGLKRRFTRASAVGDGTIRLEMDIATSLDGISERDFRHLLRLWLERKDEFEAQIGF